MKILELYHMQILSGVNMLCALMNLRVAYKNLQNSRMLKENSKNSYESSTESNEKLQKLMEDVRATLPLVSKP